MRLLTVCVWWILSLVNNCINEQLIIQLPETFANQSYAQFQRSCREVFNFTDPRNCCSIPYLLPLDVLEPCIQRIPLTSNAWEGENKCSAQYWTETNECNMLVRKLNECPYFLVHSDSF
ncbi:uncharacterized protein LOC126561085 [Anopheles maculipalpis]|uniref:uncharacterized protein LOC126561085 n=1 Tax=Anopheles maculipalpis TaxID=1496333 RepID=UPI0021593AE1|nr:uncharacterized protein LOC126561085 [Anopheles maculipalpis]